MKHLAANALSLPHQLQPDFEANQHAQEVLDRWRGKDLEDVRGEIPGLRLHEAGDQSIRYADLSGNWGDADKTVAMALPVGKAWGPESYIASKVIQEIVAPDGRLIVFPNNNRGQVAYTMSKDERKRIASGDFSPFSERQMRALEQLDIASLDLIMGRSQGATVGASLGRYIGTSANLLDEAPNTFPQGRTGVQLRKAASRERADLIPAYRHSGIPAYIEAVGADNPAKFYAGLARFIIGANFQSPNPEINKGFRHGNFYADVSEMLANNPYASVLFTNASESTVSSADNIAAYSHALNAFPTDEIARHDFYDGYHVTNGSPIAFGLQALRALQWHEQVQQDRLEPAHQAHGLYDAERAEHLRAAASMMMRNT